LARVELLAQLPGDRLRQLAERMSREEVPGGEAPVIEGDAGDRFYVILSGIFAVTNIGALGPRRVLRPGEYFGEVALAMDMPRTASVRALTPATVACADRATFDEFIRPLFAE
jgi:CRP-like cAMP-binding protein